MDRMHEREFTELSSIYAKAHRKVRAYQRVLVRAWAAIEPRLTSEFAGLADDPDPAVRDRFYGDPGIRLFMRTRGRLHLTLISAALRPFVQTLDDCAFQEHCEALFRELMSESTAEYEDVMYGPYRRRARAAVRARGNASLMNLAEEQFQRELKMREEVGARPAPLMLFAQGDRTTEWRAKKTDDGIAWEIGTGSTAWTRQ